MKDYTSKMDSQFKLPRHVSQPISNSAPHTSQFQELLMEAAPNRGEEGYARSWLEKNGVLRKRKHADDDEARRTTISEQVPCPRAFFRSHCTRRRPPRLYQHRNLSVHSLYKERDSMLYSLDLLMRSSLVRGRLARKVA